MAVNLIDRTKLDACLDAEADAIRAKTGDSNDLTFDFANDKGFADAIAAIPSGGGSQNVFVSEFTPASGSSAITFSVSEIGFAPDVCAYYARNFVVQESYSAWTTKASEGAMLLYNKGTCQGYTKTGSNDFANGVFFTVSGTTVSVTKYGSWQAGTAYTVVFAKIKG